MDDATSITQRVRQAVVRALALEIEPDELDDDESLFGEGVGADSIASLELVFALEDEFGIAVDDDELRAELFDSVRSLTRFVQEKLEATPEAAAAPAQEPGL